MDTEIDVHVMYRGIHYFSYFCSKNKLWEYEQEPNRSKLGDSFKRVHNTLCFEQNLKILHSYHLKGATLESVLNKIKRRLNGKMK